MSDSSYSKPSPKSEPRSGPQKTRSRSKDSIRYWEDRIKKPANSPHYYASIQRLKTRRKISLETSDLKKAAAKARQIYQDVRSGGWDSALRKHRPDRCARTPAGSSISIGEYISKAAALSGANARSVHSYSKALRSIIGSLLSVDGDKAKYGRGRAAKKWRAQIDSTELSWLTGERISEWKKSYLGKGRQDPVAMRSKRTSVNSLLALGKALFSKDIRKRFSVPIANPFEDVEREPRQNTRYRATFDAGELFEAARTELAAVDPEAFKCFLLGLTAGLRRAEIDSLMWSSFRWNQNLIRIEPNEFFSGKSEDSLADVAIDGEVMAIFKDYHARSNSPFVVEAIGEPRPEAKYSHYRCAEVFARLIDWLRAHGVRSRTPLHTLRKEYGSILCETGGIYCASRGLRHSSVKVTEQHYLENRSRVVVSFGIPQNVTPIAPASAPTPQTARAS